MHSNTVFERCNDGWDRFERDNLHGKDKGDEVEQGEKIIFERIYLEISWVVSAGHRRQAVQHNDHQQV